MLRRCLATSSRRQLVLGIESTFDETGASVVDMATDSVLSSVLASTYTEKFGLRFGGVVPNLAAAEHDVWLNRVIASAMVSANISSFGQLSAVAVAVGPGLAACLKAGIRRASFISRHFRVPLVRVNHLEAHLLSARLEPTLPPVSFPFLALLVSGGHTQLVVARGVGDHVFLGGTIDDAVGEAYDKVARALGVVGGGAAIERLAQHGDPTLLGLTVPLARHRNCLFSFTGLKTMVQRTLEAAEPPDSAYWKMARATVTKSAPAAADERKFMHLPLLERLAATAESAAVSDLERELPAPLAESMHVLERPEQYVAHAARPPAPEQLASDVAASFQNVAIRHLMARVRVALDWCENHCPGVDTVVLSGGVARNRALIAALGDVVAERGVRTVVPRAELCTDNGVMIAWAGVEMWRAGLVDAPLPADAPDAPYHTSMPLQRMPAPAPTQWPGTSRSTGKLVIKKYFSSV